MADTDEVGGAIAQAEIDIGQCQFGHLQCRHGPLGEREVAAQFLTGYFHINSGAGHAQEWPGGQDQLHGRAAHEEGLVHRLRRVVQLQRQGGVEHDARNVHRDRAAQTPGETGRRREERAFAIREADEGVRAIAEAQRDARGDQTRHLDAVGSGDLLEGEAAAQSLPRHVQLDARPFHPEIRTGRHVQLHRACADRDRFADRRVGRVHRDGERAVEGRAQ